MGRLPMGGKISYIYIYIYGDVFPFMGRLPIYGKTSHILEVRLVSSYESRADLRNIGAPIDHIVSQVLSSDQPPRVIDRLLTLHDRYTVHFKIEGQKVFLPIMNGIDHFNLANKTFTTT